MLSARYLAGVSDDIVKIYSQLEYDILTDMSRRLSKIGSVTDSSKMQAAIYQEIGGLQKDIQKFINKYEKKASVEMKKLFSEAIEKAEAENLKIVKVAARSMSASQEQILNATIAKTQSAGIVTGSKAVQESGVIKTFSNLSRLTMTIAATSSAKFVEQANAAYMKVVSGAFDHKTALRHAVDNLAKEGVRTVEYTDSGKIIKRSIEGAVRANILTGINQTANKITEQNCADMDCDLVEVSAHLGARPSHAAWQGKIYSLSGTSDKYPSFYEVCHPGEPDGIGGVNCRHSYYPYFEGTEPLYSNGELDEMRDNEITYQGKKITQYEAEQKLRGIERNIRKYKLKAGALEAAELDSTFERAKLGKWQATARSYCKETGIRRDYSREHVGTPDGKQIRGVNTKTVTKKTKTTAEKLFPGEKWEKEDDNLFIAKSRKEKMYKESGKINKIEKKKLEQEIASTKILTKNGHSVYLVPEHTGAGNTYDAVVDGLKMEIKTLKGSRQTIGREFRHSFRQCNNVFLNLDTDETVESIRKKFRGELMNTRDMRDGLIYCYFKNIDKLCFWKKSSLI